ncbi:MAG: histone deacetylase [Deltaproteobacteria bacterium]|nr:histone deacetylase [Deltaproteobacteria bacterium]MBW1748532.1 histone deacetylase [Deltaproteobacteria bacterium]MBW1968783.1 histone deacetylase [Deltaproteobacteria bacterium]MBW2155850.1 histone deacetylase [Deltaproteobacteria bacterium]MBW2228403.1 histone deacetylase [Deltaproteobacteria bacterium]
MKRTGFLYDERYLLHDTGPNHPESPERLKAIYQGIKQAGLLPKLTLIEAIRADLKWIETVHSKNYIKRFEAACRSDNSTFDYPDNQICADTFEIALLAVGGVLDALRRVMTGQIDNAFCAVRPPGHHAEHESAMGFCYFNNVAIAARYLQAEWGIQRVGIVDFDVHHGNGTQHIFEKDPTVFYYSIHQHPTFAFPGTGRVFETGDGEGEGATRNYPVLPGHGDKEYQGLVERDLMPVMEAFSPEVILVSAGFDAHVDDDMSDIQLSTEGYSRIMQRIAALAEHCSNGRLISVLEGGYCIKRLPELAVNHVKILLNI